MILNNVTFISTCLINNYRTIPFVGDRGSKSAITNLLFVLRGVELFVLSKSFFCSSSEVESKLLLVLKDFFFFNTFALGLTDVLAGLVSSPENDSIWDHSLLSQFPIITLASHSLFNSFEKSSLTKKTSKSLNSTFFGIYFFIYFQKKFYLFA